MQNPFMILAAFGLVSAKRAKGSETVTQIATTPLTANCPPPETVMENFVWAGLFVFTLAAFSQ